MKMIKFKGDLPLIVAILIKRINMLNYSRYIIELQPSNKLKFT